MSSPEETRAQHLALAQACARGDAAAIAAFDSEYVRVIERAVAAAGATPAETAELVQIVRVRLLVKKPGAEQPAIASFSGRSNLASWVKVVATREAARLLLRDRREPQIEDEQLARELAAGDNPELAHLKQRYREEFRVAFAEAVAALTDRDRLLLAQSLLDGLGIDALATQLAVHRATVARWLAAARESVIAGTRAVLRARLRIAPDELDSILRLIRSQLDISLPGALRDARKRTP
jgi:RNA polymerase sigma-70 factor (ECF subfamily)